MGTHEAVNCRDFGGWSTYDQDMDLPAKGAALSTVKALYILSDCTY
jgi:hypothetical protein